MRRIIIDTDPGLDDAVAILLALAASEEFEIVGIVAVAGNLPLTQTERNARRVCELARRSDVPVYAGCARPLLRSLATAEHLHVETPGDRLLQPEPAMALQSLHGVDFLIEALCAAEAGAITLCALGPLTNIAMALVKGGDLYTVNSNGTGGEVRLTNTVATEADPAYSPDGSKIAFASNVNGNYDIWIIAAGGGAPFEVTSVAGDERPDHNDPARCDASGAQHAAADRSAAGSGQSLRRGGRRIADRVRK